MSKTYTHQFTPQLSKTLQQWRPKNRPSEEDQSEKNQNPLSALIFLQSHKRYFSLWRGEIGVNLNFKMQSLDSLVIEPTGFLTMSRASGLNWIASKSKCNLTQK